MGLKAAALQQQRIPLAMHPLHSGAGENYCSFTGCLKKITEAGGRSMIHNANAALPSFCEHRLTPFFSFFPFEEKTIQMT